MPDPTFVILSGSFAAALLVFAFGAGARRFGKSATPPFTGPMPVAGGTGAEVYAVGRKAISETPPPLQPGRVSVAAYQPVDLAGVALVFLIYSALILSSLWSIGDASPVLNAPVLLTNIGFQFIMAGIVTLWVGRKIGPAAWLGLRWQDWPLAFLLAPVSVVVMWLLTGGLQLSGYLKWMEALGAETTQEAVKLLRETQDPVVLGLMAFAAVIAAPLCEEIVFRGYFYPVLKKFGGITAATLSTSLVFAAAHGNLTALLPLLVFGAILVLLYEKTGSLWAPIAAHFCFNSATVAVQFAIRHYEIPIGIIP